jgi:hypothetical protein
MSLSERWRGLWDDVRRGETRMPTRVTIAADRVAWPADEPGEAFQPNEHYFMVRVNELYLAYSREWFATFDPMVLVVSEFTYDKSELAVPFVVGPSLLESKGQEVPDGMIFSDTRVAGLHPYRGGRLTLSVVLSRVQRQNYAKKLLEIVESVAGVLDFGTSLSAYVKVGGVVLDGVSALFGLEEGATPIVGYRKEFDPDAGDPLGPSFFALIDAADEEVDQNALWVRENRLYQGPSLEESTPFRSADLVLYSIVQTAVRGDERILPFYPLFERVQQSATSTDEADWKRAKADMASLWQTLILSPDLTRPQSRQLATHYRAELDELLAEAKEMTPLGAGDGPESDEDVAALREAADILDA